MAATVNSEARFTVALLSQLLSQSLLGKKWKECLMRAWRKVKMVQVIENIECATVKLLSRAKSLKSLDATVNPP